MELPEPAGCCHVGFQIIVPSPPQSPTQGPHPVSVLGTLALAQRVCQPYAWVSEPLPQTSQNPCVHYWLGLVPRLQP